MHRGAQLAWDLDDGNRDVTRLGAAVHVILAAVTREAAPTPSSEPQRSAVARPGFVHRLKERGVVRVATSYAVIAWLLLQIADVTLGPLGAPPWAITALIIAAVAGFPIAVGLAWFLEIGADGVHVDTAAEGAARPRARGLRHYADAVVIGILLVTVVVLLVRQSDIGKPKPPEQPAIAVLPFQNLSGDPEQEYFSDGLAEEMLDRLGRVPGLRVIARSSSFGFKGKDLDAKAIAEKIGVTTLLEGSVRRDGRRLRLSTRLIDGATGQQIWSGSFDREIQDVFAVQAELAAAIVNAIAPAARGSPGEDPTPPTSDLDAYDLYLASKSELLLRTPESIDKAVTLAEQSVRADPDFARGQAQLANSLLFQALFLDEHEAAQSAALLRRAEPAIHKALSLDPDLSEAHGAYANLLRSTDRPGAEEHYKRALELNPNNAASWHDYAVYLGNSDGRQEEADRATRRALELDPRQPVTWANYLGGLGDPRSPRFREEYERALHMVGDMPFAIDRFTMPALSTPGFPVMVMEAAVAKKKANFPANLPLWINCFRAWVAVDPERAAGCLPATATEQRHGVDMEAIRLFLEVDIAGIRGDWPRVDRSLELLDARPWAEDARVQSVRAFWYAVQGRNEPAAESLAIALPIPDLWVPPVMGGDAIYGLMETAQVRIYRATARADEAQRLAAGLLRQLRSDERAVGEDCMLKGSRYEGWMRHASLAANEGLKDEAVAALRGAHRCGDLPPSFVPALPWFRQLDGYPPYEALKREREQRIERIRAELLQIETEGGLTAALQAEPTPANH
jgi:TolB-like protein